MTRETWAQPRGLKMAEKACRCDTSVEKVIFLFSLVSGKRCKFTLSSTESSRSLCYNFYFLGANGNRFLASSIQDYVANSCLN